MSAVADCPAIVVNLLANHGTDHTANHSRNLVKVVLNGVVPIALRSGYPSCT